MWLQNGCKESPEDMSFSFVGKNTPTEGLTIGDKAPTFTICGEKQLIDLKDLRGKYVLLSFWASYDALSRMQNATLNHAVAHDSEKHCGN